MRFESLKICNGVYMRMRNGLLNSGYSFEEEDALVIQFCCYDVSSLEYLLSYFLLISVDFLEVGGREIVNLWEEPSLLIVAGGGMYVEVFNRGVIPLAYGIKRKNKAGESNTYLDGIYLLFTYFTKPDSMNVLETRLKTDDDVIRFSSFKMRKRKY
ncbi:hypothetical protein GIB67_001575 [Kingdonia uniflora]|uniref:Ribosomal protein S6 n=1 Tax=Kingdonia uniflora TaxID=39325 RepID=A0A7J7L0L6_9MAGN|nr:hypothetical protein GIB67_001575 [Kingdonia uniflora]